MFSPCVHVFLLGSLDSSHCPKHASRSEADWETKISMEIWIKWPLTFAQSNINESALTSITT